MSTQEFLELLENMISNEPSGECVGGGSEINSGLYKLDETYEKPQK